MAKIGRPRAFTDPQTLEESIEEYFAMTEAPSVEGLAVSLGVSRETLHKYGSVDYGLEFSDIIKKAKTRILATVISGAMTSKINPTFAIFY